MNLTKTFSIYNKLKRKRSQNTSNDQYELYLEYMENDPAFRCGVATPELGDQYIETKWAQLVNELNSMEFGPYLTIEEWKKRFSDWKYSTRSKLKRLTSQRKKALSAGGINEVRFTKLERRGLVVWGKGADIDANFPLILKYESVSDDNNEQHVVAKVPPMKTETDQQYINEKYAHDDPVAMTAEANISIPQVNTTKELKPADLTEHLIKEILNKSMAKFGESLQFFSENYIKLERDKLMFEIAKYKYEHKDFEFNF